MEVAQTGEEGEGCEKFHKFFAIFLKITPDIVYESIAAFFENCFWKIFHTGTLMRRFSHQVTKNLFTYKIKRYRMELPNRKRRIENMETLESLCKMYGIIGLVYYEETERFICVNGKILYNKETGIITLLS